MHDLGPFRHDFNADRFVERYQSPGARTWWDLARILAERVCGPFLTREEVKEVEWAISEMFFIPGGRYLYYAARDAAFFNNCYLLRSEEDSREDWGELAKKSALCLMTGGGIGNDYTIYREKGAPLGRTGGVSSGPIPAMHKVNEIGRAAIQGGGRRAAVYASLAREHPDIMDFLRLKNWDEMEIPGTNGATYGDAKRADFMFPAPMDHTNISTNYGDEWLALPNRAEDEVFLVNCEQALRTAEPGFSFNFGAKARETLRNACTEVTSEDDSDVCNLGSLNLSRIPDRATLQRVIRAATKFLLCGTLVAELPYQKVYDVREKNRRLGLGLMGVHEWLLRRGHRYEVVPELHEWLTDYRDISDEVSADTADRLSISRPVANRAIAPTGTIGIMAGTTTGIEPLFAVAYLRRFMKGLEVYQDVYIEPVAKGIIEDTGVDADSIETAMDLAADPERRLAFQADVQDYVDMAISSTINLPSWGSDLNNPDTVKPFAQLLAKYAPRLRGFTCYPDGARGGQPLTAIPYADAVGREGVVEKAIDICDLSGKGGTCGV